MRVGVTGATGLIGRHLVRLLLERGDSVRILSRRAPAELQLPTAVSVHRADLAKPDDNDALAHFVDGADVLYHAAGQLKETAEMHSLHVEGSKRLLAAAAGKIGHWVHLSSVGTYGPISNGIVTEETPLSPVGPYECTKAQSDALVERYAEAGAFTYTILRPSNVFGPGMTGQSLFHLIGTIKRHLFFFIGEPGASANYIAVGNVVDALVRCGTMPQARGKIFNVSDYRPLEEFITSIAVALGVTPPSLRLPEAPVRLIAKLFGRLPHMPLTSSRIDALVNRAVYSTSRIERELEYRHRVSMEEAVGELVRAWR